MDLGLRETVVLVTGGVGRLGKTICAAFAAEGALVAVVDHQREAATRIAQQLEADGYRATAVAIDVTDRSGWIGLDSHLNGYLRDN